MLVFPQKLKVEECIEQYKNNKSAGENDISEVILKYGAEALTIRIWNMEEKVSKEWNKALRESFLKKNTGCNL